MKKMTRRNFLKGLTATSCGAATMGTFPGLGVGALQAQDAENIEHLLILRLGGGADTLALFQPDMGVLADVRPTIYASEEDTLSIADTPERPNVNGTRFHQDFSFLATLYNLNWVSIIQKVGYESISRSHEEAQRVYSRGVSSRTDSVDTGWVNRLAIANNFQSLDVFDIPSGTITTRTGAYEPTLVNKLVDYRLQNPHGSALDGEFLRGTAFKMIESYRNGKIADTAVKSSWRGVEAPIDIIQQAAALETSTVNPFPDTTLGNRLREAWRVFDSIGSKVVHVATGGYDTHGGDKANQAQNYRLGSTRDEEGEITRKGLVKQLDEALLAYLIHMFQSGLFEKSMVMIVTEFSRTIRENKSQGTDHGRGSSVVLIGPNLRPGIHNPFSESDITSGNFLPYNTNVVSIYRQLVERMGYDPNLVFGSAPDFQVFA